MNPGRETHYPFADPQNRHEARENAKWFVINGRTEVARAWAEIALTFPEDTQVVVDNVSDFQRQVLESYPALTDGPVSAYPVSGYPLLTDGPEPGFDGVNPPDHFRSIDESVTQVLQLPHTGHVTPSGASVDTNGTIVVDAVAWDVLRALAIRYVLSSMSKTATVDLTEDGTLGQVMVWDLQLVRLPDSPIVTATVERIES